MVEVKLVVTVQVDANENEISDLLVQQAARQAVFNAIMGDGGDNSSPLSLGFIHPYPYDVSIGLVSVEVEDPQGFAPCSGAAYC